MPPDPLTTVELSRQECVNDLLPKVCVRCGAPAAGCLPVQYSWAPKWSVWLVFTWPLFSRTMLVRLPLCEPHLTSWRKRNFRYQVALVAVLVLGMGTYASMLIYPNTWVRDLAVWLCSGWALLFFIWLFVAIIAAERDIKTIRITERSLTLNRIHEAFVAALAEERQRNEDPHADRRFGDLRDDFDEDA